LFSEEPNYALDRVLVQFTRQKESECLLSEAKVALVKSICGGTIEHEYGIVPGLTLVKLPKGQAVEDSLESLNTADGILYAEPDYIYRTASIPNDSYFTQLWGLHNTGQTGGTSDADIDAPEAWDIKTDADEIIIAVLDTGVYYTHPDLSANMWTNPGEIPGNGIDDDKNGYVDDVYGWNFFHENNNTLDEDGHGTRCAGIIGAVGNNAQGVTGICWNIKIMGLKITFLGSDEWTFYVSNAIQGIEYAINKEAKVLNASWGAYDYSQSLKDAIDAANTAGVLFVAAAGNECNNNDFNGLYPASYNCDNIISVMASDAYDRRSIWPEYPASSNWGPNSVDLAAPGTDIYTPGLGGTYYYMDGTSAATPYVAGAAALVWATNPTLSHLQVKKIILDTVDVIPALQNDPNYGRLCLTAGRLNLYKAVREALKWKIFKMTDDVNDNSCRKPGDEITYIISYANPPIGDANYLGTLNDVNFIDYLSGDVDFVTSSGDWTYDSNSRTVKWDIGTIEPNESGSVTLTVKAKSFIEECNVITNRCEVKTGDWTTHWLYERTPLCCASNSRPSNGAEGALYLDEPQDINLVWCKGLFAADVNGHDIYFGTDFDEVSRAASSWPVAKDANDPNVHKGRQSSTKWLAKGLIPETTYYWRVDEVNDYGPAPGIWPGAVGDLSDDGLVDLNDLNILCQQWLTDGPDAVSSQSIIPTASLISKTWPNLPMTG
jgi:subtilisin family serine protease